MNPADAPTPRRLSGAKASVLWHMQTHPNFWRAVARCSSGCVALALLTLACYRLGFDLAATVCVYLIVVVLVSLQGSFLSSALISLIAAGCLAYYFAPPPFSFGVSDPRHVVGIISFLTASAVITRLVSRVQKSTEGLQEQANLLNLTQDCIFVRDMQNVITYWNRGAEELYMLTAKEVVGKMTTHQLLRTVFPAPLEEIEAELLRTGRWEGELLHTKPDGTRVVVASRWSLQRDKRQQPVAVLELNTDVTGRRQAEDALRRQANLLEQTHDAIIVWEFSRTITFWNRGAEQLYGFSREEAIGRLSHELLQTQHPVPTSAFVAALEREGEWNGELIHTARDGRKILVESRHLLMREADGRHLVLETNRDITERKRAEESLRQAQADLAHVSRVTTMGELTASLAHEVNQPIAAAVTNANACIRWLARDTPDVEEARAAAVRSAKDGMRAAEIIGRIGLLFRKGIPQREFVNMNEVVREMIVLLRGEGIRNNISVRTELAAESPAVLGDRVQLQQVLMNLIINGIEAMKDADGTRELVIKSQRAENEQVVVTVSDTGVGLPAQQEDQIFKAFFTTKPHGTGMGLSISRSIVESHGGRLWAANNSPRGASFHFALPAKVEVKP